MVPKTLSNCVNMDEFNVEGNNIAQLPVSFRIIYKVRYLYLLVLCKQIFSRASRIFLGGQKRLVSSSY